MSAPPPVRGGWIAGVLILGAVLTFASGIGIGIVFAFAPETAWLPQAVRVFAAVAAAFFSFGLLSTLSLTVRLLRSKTASPVPAPDPVRRDTRRVPAQKGTELATLFQQVKTYIDLEMWELAYDKAQQILKLHPDSHEAAALQRNLNDLRWKAEPKYLPSPEEQMSREEEDRLLQRGLRQMVETVKTYVSLEMWDLARQKAVAVMQNFPDSPQADEITQLYPEIERRCRKSAGPTAAPASEEARPTEGAAS